MVPRTKPYISFIGNESYAEDTVISWSDKASDLDSNGQELGTCRTATVSIESDFFCATAITFEVLFLFLLYVLRGVMDFDLFLNFEAEHGGG